MTIKKLLPTTAFTGVIWIASNREREREREREKERERERERDRER